MCLACKDIWTVYLKDESANEGEQSQCTSDRIFVCFRDDSRSPERKEKKKKSKKHKRDR